MATDFYDVGFTANVGFDLTKFNFRDLANGAPAFQSKTTFTYLYNKTTSGIDYLQFSSEKGDIKYLTGVIPVSGTINSIFNFHYDVKTNQFSDPKYYAYDLNLKVEDVLAVLKTPKDLTDDAKLIAKLFAGNDVITGSSESDVLVGFGGDDYIRGNASDDFLYGDAGKDSLFGDAGKDRLFGGAGVNYLEGGAGGDLFFGQGGTDWAVYSNAKSQKDGVTGVTVNLSNSNDNTGDEAAGDGYFKIKVQSGGLISSVENLMGSRYNDKLTGDNGRNVIQGDAGADLLEGKGGGDVFVFSAEIYGGTFDTIIDFTPDSDKSKTDLIGLNEDYFFGIGSVGEKDSDGLAGISSKAFHSSKAGVAHDLDDRIIYDSDDHNLYYDPDGSNVTNAATLIAHFDGRPNLTVQSIRVVDLDLLV